MKTHRLPGSLSCQGPLHFWLQDKKLEYILPDDFADKEAALPPICFAAHSPISKINSRQFLHLIKDIPVVPTEEVKYYAQG